jgi:hypothetical protein
MCYEINIRALPFGSRVRHSLFFLWSNHSVLKDTSTHKKGSAQTKPLPLTQSGCTTSFCVFLMKYLSKRIRLFNICVCFKNKLVVTFSHQVVGEEL